MKPETMVEWLLKASMAIYLATDSSVADDISPKLRQVAFRVKDLEASVNECLGWIRHWQADVAGNLKPTPDSLAMMEAKLVAILQPVEAPEAAE